MKFGVHTGPQNCTAAELRQVWQTCEDVGFDWISIWDHFYSNPRPLDLPNFEGLVSHAVLGATTTRVRVGALVYCTAYRHPAALANAAATIDHFSGGRLELGLGAGWHQAEYEAYGIPFESPGTRLRRLQESVEVIRLLWTSDAADYEGEFYTLKQAHGSPPPIQRTPPIWIGANGDKALAMAGRIADGWNTPAISPAEFARRNDLVRAAAPDPDRLANGLNLIYLSSQPDGLDAELQRRQLTPNPLITDYLLVADDLDAVGERVQAYADAGVQLLVLTQRAPFDHDALAAFADKIIPAFR
ncbi:MAG: LLM class flavin-dependent oxidoreductase [Acidimicrobiia bacterium]|nr:LLM class flavin-dependent oxidoreductase [Acidimicrobiia bacterium]